MGHEEVQQMVNKQMNTLKITGGFMAEWAAEIILIIALANALKRKEFDGLDLYLLLLFELGRAKVSEASRSITRGQRSGQSIGYKRRPIENIKGPAKGVIIENEINLTDDLQEIKIGNKGEEAQDISFQTPPTF